MATDREIWRERVSHSAEQIAPHDQRERERGGGGERGGGRREGAVA